MSSPGDPEVLTGGDWLDGVASERGGSVEAAISNAMVGLKKHYFGKGPEKARTYINDNYVFCVLEGGVTRSEQMLLDAGEERMVRQVRLRFQEVMGPTTCSAVARLTGQAVLTYQSQIMFDPHIAVEMFVLDQPPG